MFKVNGVVFGGSVIIFEHISHGVVLLALLLTLNIFHTFILVFLLLTLNMQLPTGLGSFFARSTRDPLLSLFKEILVLYAET